MNVESTDTNPITDINIDFDVFQVDDSSTNVESDLNSYCDPSDSDENELGILDNLLQSNDSQNFQFLHYYTNIFIHNFCRELAKFVVCVLVECYICLSYSSIAHIIMFSIDETTASDFEEDNFFDSRKRHRKSSKEVQLKKMIVTSKKNYTNRHLTSSCESKLCFLRTNFTVTVLDKNDDEVEINDSIDMNEKTKSANKINSNSVPDIINSSKLHQQIERLSNKIDRLASMTNINRHALEPYAAKSGQFFPPELLHEKKFT
ncbi:unnamed protein product [Rotaria sp. Silwood2]|nr:unnamed protein product [Rotaria sp. Silwood2]